MSLLLSISSFLRHNRIGSIAVVGGKGGAPLPTSALASATMDSSSLIYIDRFLLKAKFGSLPLTTSNSIIF